MALFFRNLFGSINFLCRLVSAISNSWYQEWDLVELLCQISICRWSNRVSRDRDLVEGVELVLHNRLSNLFLWCHSRLLEILYWIYNNVAHLLLEKCLVINVGRVLFSSCQEGACIVFLLVAMLEMWPCQVLEEACFQFLTTWGACFLEMLQWVSLCQLQSMLHLISKGWCLGKVYTHLLTS